MPTAQSPTAGRRRRARPPAPPLMPVWVRILVVLAVLPVWVVVVLKSVVVDDELPSTGMMTIPGVILMAAAPNWRRGTSTTQTPAEPEAAPAESEA